MSHARSVCASAIALVCALAEAATASFILPPDISASDGPMCGVRRRGAERRPTHAVSQPGGRSPRSRAPRPATACSPSR